MKWPSFKMFKNKFKKLTHSKSSIFLMNYSKIETKSLKLEAVVQISYIAIGPIWVPTASLYESRWNDTIGNFFTIDPSIIVTILTEFFHNGISLGSKHFNKSYVIWIKWGSNVMPQLLMKCFRISKTPCWNYGPSIKVWASCSMNVKNSWGNASPIS